MQGIVLAGAVRTAIGKFGGTLKDVPAAELGKIVIREALRRASLSPERVDEVFMGCVLQTALGQNVARQAAIGAGIPDSVPATTLNNVCGSGLRAVNLAAALIASGEGHAYVAGGMENMSATAYALPKARFGLRMNDTALIDCLVKDGLWDAFNSYHMGITAENVAKKYGITRLMQDEFALSSQRKCQDARARNIFVEEIVPVSIKIKREVVEFCADEYPRVDVTLESLAALSAAFESDGTVTAGNASGINDGASAVIVLREDRAAEWGVKPLARVVSHASAGVDPAYMGIAPVYAVRRALEKAGLVIEDIDIMECNEAFAAQSVAVVNELGIDPEKVNVNGGAIALGHPIGASGCRILTTLLYELKRRKLRYGIATLCVGGGMGVATIVENLL